MGYFDQFLQRSVISGLYGRSDTVQAVEWPNGITRQENDRRENDNQGPTHSFLH